MKCTLPALAVLASSLALVGCGRDWPEDEKKTYAEEIVIPGEKSAAAAPAEVLKVKTPAEEAKSVFSTRCAACHGAAGKGDGPGAAAVNPKPRNFTDAEWQAATADDAILKAIAEGGAAVGKSPVMPANPDIQEPVLKELVALIRGFKS